MELSDIIKAAEGKELDSGVIDAIKALDQSATVERLEKELTAEQGKSKGILEDKKRYKTERDAHKEALDKIENDKLPEEEKHLKAMKELQEKLDAEKAGREAQAADFAKAQRDAKLSDLTASVKWATGTPSDTGKLIIQNAMAGVEDLDDKAKVDEILNTVRESHKSFIAADAAGGTGNKQDMGGGAGVGGNEEPNIADNQKALWGDK